jgi:penicillin-binding protein 2
MATKDSTLTERSGSLVEAHKNYDPRIVFFYFVLAALLLTLVVGLAYQQLRKTGEYADAERQQNEGVIYARASRSTSRCSSNSPGRRSGSSRCT